MPEKSDMSNADSPPTSTLASYMEHTASMLSSAASYMRLPALASTVCHAGTFSCGQPYRHSNANIQVLHRASPPS
jgi:hypothetical protein